MCVWFVLMCVGIDVYIFNSSCNVIPDSKPSTPAMIAPPSYVGFHQYNEEEDSQVHTCIPDHIYVLARILTTHQTQPAGSQ